MEITLHHQTLAKYSRFWQLTSIWCNYQFWNTIQGGTQAGVGVRTDTTVGAAATWCSCTSVI